MFRPAASVKKQFKKRFFKKRPFKKRSFPRFLAPRSYFLERSYALARRLLRLFRMYLDADIDIDVCLDVPVGDYDLVSIFVCMPVTDDEYVWLFGHAASGSFEVLLTM
ncbi:uncharacterized protein LOC135221992 [Macrobrachium nipponense]|uniref:uncharacterized protein LOC135221992 n=1 Tax=Macrobrachium nipponense TaxID=159736 RepID=UPI0030C8CB98